MLLVSMVSSFIDLDLKEPRLMVGESGEECKWEVMRRVHGSMMMWYGFINLARMWASSLPACE